MLTHYACAGSAGDVPAAGKKTGGGSNKDTCGAEQNIRAPKFFGTDVLDEYNIGEPEQTASEAFEFASELQAFRDLGLRDVKAIKAALRKCDGDAAAAVNFLLG